MVYTFEVSTLADLLADPGAHRILVLKMAYMDEDRVEQELWLSQENWADPPGGPVGEPIRPLLQSNLVISDSCDPYDMEADSETTESEIILLNDASYTEWAGFFNRAYLWSIDEREQLLYLVGTLSDGTRIELADVLATPFQRLVGVGSPTAGGDLNCALTVRTQQFGMTAPASEATYTPSCAVFPGGNVSVISYGDNFDLGSQGHIRVKIMCEDVTVANQYIWHKDDGAAGFLIRINSGGASPGSIQFLCRGQTPAATATASNALVSGRWHIVAFDWTATTRRIDVDGAQAGADSSITGATTVNAVGLTEGLNFRGQIGEIAVYNVSKSVATAAPELRAPVLPGDAALVAHIPHDEGSGLVVHDLKAGSSITGTLGTGVTLDGVAGWHYPGLGPYQPFFLGRVAHSGIEWFDHASQIAMVCAGGYQLLETLRFAYETKLTSVYTTDRDRGTLRLTSGSIPQTGAGVQALANSPWGTALQFASGSTMLAAATQAGPTGSRSLTAHVRCDEYSTTLRYIAGRHAAANPAGCFVLRLTTSGFNLLEVLAVNDAGTVFLLSAVVPLPLDRRVFVAARLDAAANRLSLWVDRAEVASMTTSGAWTTSISGWGTGNRSTGANRFVGIVDDAHEWSVSLSDAALKLLHLAPVIGTETGLWYGHGLNEGSGASAASTVAGKAALTITDPSWGAGRCAAGDLAWQIYRAAGYADSVRDADSWGVFIASQPADCGWRVEGGQLRTVVAQKLLGGVGARTRELFGLVYVNRFEGVTGVPTRSLTVHQVRGGPAVTPGAAESAVYSWRLLARKNDLKLPRNEVAAALLASDPPGYTYASSEGEWAPARDEGIRQSSPGVAGPFPAAIEMKRVTPFFRKVDALVEAARLRELFRDGSAPVDLQVRVDAEDLAVLDELPAFEGLPEAGLDLGGSVVIALHNDDGNTLATLWRPGALQPALLGGDDDLLFLTDSGYTIALEAA